MKRVFSLKGRDAFKEVFRKGRRYQQQGIQILVLKQSAARSDDKNQNSLADSSVKMGISINRHYGKAHDRNLAKRQIRAIWSGYLSDMKQGFHILVRPSRESGLLKYEEKRLILEELLRKAGVLV